MISALFAASVAQQTIPPTQIYASVPNFHSSLTGHPEFQIHGATVYLGVNESKVETLTNWHNSTNAELKGKIKFKVSANGYGFSGLKKFAATWNKQPIEFRVESVNKEKTDLNVLLRPSQVMTIATDVSIPANGTGSLTLEWLQPTTKYGMNKDARQFVYDLEELPNTPDQLRLAIKYSPEVVFKTLRTDSPIGKWEVGNNGAYLKLDGMRQKDGFAVYQFYPVTRE